MSEKNIRSRSVNDLKCIYILKLWIEEKVSSIPKSKCKCIELFETLMLPNLQLKRMSETDIRKRVNQYTNTNEPRGVCLKENGVDISPNTSRPHNRMAQNRAVKRLTHRRKAKQFVVGGSRKSRPLVPVNRQRTVRRPQVQSTRCSKRILASVKPAVTPVQTNSSKSTSDEKVNAISSR